MDLKRVTFMVEAEMYKKAKIRAVQNDQNMTEYLTELIIKDLGDKETKKE